MEKILFIYNPMSGHRNIAGKLDYIIACFMKQDIIIQLYRTTGSDKEKLLELMLKDNYQFIVVSGGDGTLNMIVNIMLQNNVNIPLGIIPSGTCNDLARSLNIPIEFKKCIETILHGNITSIDIGLINDQKYFIGTCAGGVFTDVSYNTNCDMKKNVGPFAYYLKALTEVKNIKPIRLKINSDIEFIEDDFLLFMILNGKHAAGFYNISEKADIADGYMDMILVKNCAHVDLAGIFINAMKSDFINNKHVIRIKTRNCEISSDENVIVSIDGEKWGTLPVKVKFLHKYLKVIT